MNLKEETEKIMKPKLFEIIENEEVFKYMLAGFFKDWQGTYDVLFADTGQYLIYPKNKEAFKSFCQFVRNTPGGAKLCLECDINHAEEASKNRKPISYFCDIGLLDIAIPIMVDDELIATILCGQSRAQDPNEDVLGNDLTITAENYLNIPDGTLQKLREEILPISEEKIEEVKHHLWKMATYLSSVGHEKKILKIKLGEIGEIRQALSLIDGVIENIDIFWYKVSKLLEKLNRIIGAARSILIMKDYHPRNDNNIFNVKSFAGFLEGCPSTIEIKEFEISKIVKPAIYEVNNLFLDELFTKGIDKVAIIPLRLDLNYSGYVIFFTVNYVDTKVTLPISEKLNLLAILPGWLATAYQNCRLHSMRREWLKILCHQLIAPLNGIQGHAENIFRWIGIWENPLTQVYEAREDDLSEDNKITIELTMKRLKNTISSTESMLWMSKSVSQIARNFAWIADIGNEAKLSSIKPYNGMVPLLINCARNVQGLAKKRGIRRVHVDQDSVKQLDGKLRLHKETFSQAVLNLLDNAVKYSDKKTDILITAMITKNQGKILVTNRGIPIKEEEIEKVFEQEYRTEAAKARYAIGMGIGLTISRRIIFLHGGDLCVISSKKISEIDYDGYETTFIISLPIL